MVDVNINVEVHGFRPAWARNNPNIKYSQSRYRLYVNNDMIVERDWSWGNDIYLNENIWVHCEYNETYLVSLHPVITIKNQAEFVIKNLTLNNKNSIIKPINEKKIEYSLINTI